jgi:hypothetical protein
VVIFFTSTILSHTQASFVLEALSYNPLVETPIWDHSKK